jgi:hypothetical protein
MEDHCEGVMVSWSIILEGRYLGGKVSNKTAGRSIMPIVMMVVGLILILGAGIWYISTISNTSPDAPEQAPEVVDNYPDIPRVSVADAKAAHDMGSAVFLDVRDGSEYALGHIPGAVSIPLTELSARMNELEPSAWIIPY